MDPPRRKTTQPATATDEPPVKEATCGAHHRRLRRPHPLHASRGLKIMAPTRTAANSFHCVQNMSYALSTFQAG
jgi:hypothetical protein